MSVPRLSVLTSTIAPVPRIVVLLDTLKPTTIPLESVLNTADESITLPAIVRTPRFNLTASVAVNVCVIVAFCLETVNVSPVAYALYRKSPPRLVTVISSNTAALELSVYEPIGVQETSTVEPVPVTMPFASAT